MTKLADMDPFARGQIVYGLMKKLPPEFAQIVRRFRRSPKLQHWEFLRICLVPQTRNETVWAAVEKVNCRRFPPGEVPARLDIDNWLYTYFN